MADKGVANGQARAIICARSRCQSIDRYENSMQQRLSPIEYITTTLPFHFLAELELPSTCEIIIKVFILYGFVDDSTVGKDERFMGTFEACSENGSFAIFPPRALEKPREVS
uniref:Uncharacterized protein n=1 Tax=Vespula pensylvanica TaxID=30213 RepID=A0A834PAC4_VESPE|nr:hypothetical protein H0235_002578 [Vespula pensylvanica]